MANRVLQGAVLNNIQFVPANQGLPIAYKQWQMGKEWFRQAQLSWQKKTTYSQKVQLTDRINVQYNRTEFNDINLYILSCDGTELENLTSLAQKCTVPGNTYDGEQLNTHHFSFRFQDYALPAGKYYLRLDAVYYDDDDEEIDRLTEISEPLDVKADHPNTVYMQYQYLVNKENVIFINPDINTFRFGLRFEGYIGEYQPDSADVYFKEQNYNQRNISSTPWRKFSLEVGGMKAVPPYIIEKVNAALSCGINNGVLLINGVEYTKDDGAKLEKEPLNNDVYPMFTASCAIREKDPTQVITFSRNSSFQIVEGMAYPFHVQRVDFNNPQRVAVVLANINKYTVIEDSAGLDAFIDYLNTVRFQTIGLSGTAERRGDDVWYINGENETYTLGFRIQNQYKLTFTVAAVATPLPMNLLLAEGYGTIYWGNDRLTLHEPINTSSYAYNTVYQTDNTYQVELWHNGIISTVSHAAYTIVNGVKIYGARITDIDGAAPWKMKIFILTGDNFSGLASGLDLSFLSASGIVQDSLTTLAITESGLVGLDGTVFAANPWQAQQPWWAALKVVNINGNAFTVSEINSLVSDFYVNTRHNIIGTLDLRQVPPAVATGTAATQLTNLRNAGWNILP